jgi:hypothetical protein
MAQKKTFAHLGLSRARVQPRKGVKLCAIRRREKETLPPCKQRRFVLLLLLLLFVYVVVAVYEFTLLMCVPSLS